MKTCRRKALAASLCPLSLKNARALVTGISGESEGEGEGEGEGEEMHSEVEHRTGAVSVKIMISSSLLFH